MRPTVFLDYFPELEGIPKDKQIAILESARYDAFVRQRLVGKATLAMVVSYLLAALIVFFPLLSGMESLFMTALFAGLGSLTGAYIHKQLYGRLLRRGVTVILNS